MKTVGSKKMTPHEDRIAALLVEMGYSCRRVGFLLNKSDKTVRDGAARGSKSKEGAFTPRQERRATELLAFHAWLGEGAEKGYLEPLAAWFEGDRGEEVIVDDAELTDSEE
jgi:transposase